MANSGHQEEFISRGTFKKLCLQKKEEERDIKTWTELPTDGTIYKIIDSKQLKGKYGDCLLLTIKTKLGEESKVFAPKKLQKEVGEEVTKSKPRTIYFCSLGQNKKQDGSGHLLNEYDICFK